MAAQPPPTHFNPYYNDIILRNVDGTNNSASIKLIEKANEGCPLEDRFTGKRGTLLTFLKMLERYSREFDWERVRRISDRQGDTYDIFTQYAQISLADVIHFQDTSIWNHRITQQNALALTQKKLRLTYMHQKIEKCCNQKVLNELQKKQNLFCKPDGQADGIVFLKLLVDKYTSKTVYTARNIIKSFRTIKLSDFDHSVERLYEHLEEEVTQLECLGSSHDHLLSDVFDILKTSTNEDFIKDIKEEEKKYERGQAMDWTDLMDTAVDLYKDQIDKGTWNVKDPRDEKILALGTIIKQMVAFSSIKNGSEPTKNKNNRKFKPIDAWKFIRNNNEITKNVNGTDYHWCPYHYEHGMWTTHESGSCGRKDSHVPSVYDAKVHEAQWNKKNKSSSSTSSTSAPATSASASSNSNLKFQLDSKLQHALYSIVDGDDVSASAFLAAYGIEDESQTKND